MTNSSTQIFKLTMEIRFITDIHPNQLFNKLFKLIIIQYSLFVVYKIKQEKSIKINER
jgi:hypothetical protein